MVSKFRAGRRAPKILGIFVVQGGEGLDIQLTHSHIMDLLSSPPSTVSQSLYEAGLLPSIAQIFRTFETRQLPAL